MSTLEQMRNADRDERDRRIFHARCESFLKRWEPRDLRERHEFAADLMMLFRDLQITQAQAYGEVVARQMEMAPMQTVFVAPKSGR